MKTFNLRLYLVTDEACLKQKNLPAAVEEALRAGVTLVHDREKNGMGKEMLQKAVTLRELCHRYHVPFIVNDRLDVALLSDADGVHLGQDDLPVAEARKLVGPDFIIGATAHTVQEALAAQAAGADYLGCGAVFATTTKKDTVPLGLHGLQAIRNMVHIPIVGIAGITPQNYKQVLATGANGVAVVSGILGAENITEAVNKFLNAPAITSTIL